MIIGTVLALLKRAKYMKSVLKKYQSVLSPGRYRLFENFRSACLNDAAALAEATKYFPVDKPNSARMRIASVLNKSRYFSLRCPTSTGEYEAVYVANNFDAVRETKLFSFRQRKILTFCTGQEQMNKQLQEYDQLHHAYKMPSVVRNENFENALDVAMIGRLDFPGNGCALTAIAEATVSYNADTAVLSRKSVKELIAFSYGDEAMNTYLTGLAEDISEDVLSNSIPLCMQHGDLSKDNLIYGESGGETAFWWIDWEHRKERVFFYDYFFIIINSALYDDIGAFQCYICGENDETLKTYFSHFGMKYDPNKRWDYFLAFAIAFLKERVCDLGHVGALIKYCDLIKRLKNDNGNGIFQ